MKNSQKGFSVLGILIAVVIISLIGGAGWYVWQSEKKNSNAPNTVTTETKDNQSSEQAKESDHKTVDGIKYTIPSGWTNTDSPYKTGETGIGQYLLSPDYKEYDNGQLSIESGSIIQFQRLEWVGIDTSISLDQAVSVIKNGEGGYLDTNSVKLMTVGEKQVVIFDSGHTTDGVSVFHKTATNLWLDISFSTITGEDSDYNSQDSPDYNVFLSWLEKFIELNP